jgi:hypothetical protein
VLSHNSDPPVSSYYVRVRDLLSCPHQKSYVAL